MESLILLNSILETKNNEARVLHRSNSQQDNSMGYYSFGRNDSNIFVEYSNVLHGAEEGEYTAKFSRYYINLPGFPNNSQFSKAKVVSHVDGIISPFEQTEDEAVFSAENYHLAVEGALELLSDISAVLKVGKSAKSFFDSLSTGIQQQLNGSDVGQAA
jgi:hypothetical protein